MSGTDTGESTKVEGRSTKPPADQGSGARTPPKPTESQETMTVAPSDAPGPLRGSVPSQPNTVVEDVAFADTEADASALEDSGLLGGKYRIERSLAAGGMGQVVIAEHLDLGRRVAIKLLRRELVRDSKTAERFRQEAKIVAKLKSPHVVRVFDVGSLDDGTPYIVMEFLEGEPLNRFISRNAPVPIEQAVEIILQALDGIAEAHSAGVVHRDLKPHNLFVTSRVDGARVIKVLDFGISKVATEISLITDASTGGITLPNEILGTPIYMAPEQVTNSKDVDGRADLWSMGVILREMITGKRLFQGASPSAVFANILRDPVPDLLTECSSVPAGLDDVLARILARDRDQRFSTAKDMATALLPFAPVHTPHSTPVLPGNLPPPAGSAAPRPSVGSIPPPIHSTSPPPRKRFWLFVAAWFVAGALAAVWYSSSRKPTPPHASRHPTPSCPPKVVRGHRGRLAPLMGPTQIAASSRST